MKISVIGGGNIGTLIAAELSLDSRNDVRLYATKAHLFSNEIIIDDWNDNVQKTAYIKTITSNKEEALKGAEIILITVPAGVLSALIDDIFPYVENNSIIGMIPGSGGAEFPLSRLQEKGCIIFGLQRVPSIARLREYGKVVSNQGRKKELAIACIPSSSGEKISRIIESLFDIPCRTFSNYLNITFTPSNQILHTARIFAIYKDYFEGREYPARGFFYKDWDDYSSKILISCDNELQTICRALSSFDLSGVVSLLLHYEVKNYKDMTQKLSTIKAFENILTPMIQLDNGNYIPDKDNRYFTSDFPFGLCIIKGFGVILEIETPSIDKVLKWYERFAGVEYFVNNEFIGKDLINTGIPQNYGLLTKTSIIEFYIKP